jgi:hypothetical protein
MYQIKLKNLTLGGIAMLAKGSKWKCVDDDMEELGQVCELVEDVDTNPDFNGEQDVEYKYENGSGGYMKLRRFTSRFQPVQKKKTWGRSKVMNAINEKYNLYPCEITSFQEADEFWTNYLAPIATIAPNFFDQLDADIGLAIMNNWGEDNETLAKADLPLLVKSTIWKQL